MVGQVVWIKFNFLVKCVNCYWKKMRGSNMAHDLMRCSRPTIVCQCMQPTTRVKWHGYLSHLVPLTKPPVSAAATTNTSYCFDTATDIYKYGEKMCMCCCLVWGCLMKRILPLLYSVPAFFPWLPGAASPNSIWNWFHTGGPGGLMRRNWGVSKDVSSTLVKLSPVWLLQNLELWVSEEIKTKDAKLDPSYKGSLAAVLPPPALLHPVERTVEVPLSSPPLQQNSGVQ